MRVPKLSSVCAALEAEIAQLDEEDKKVFLDDLGLAEPGLDRDSRRLPSCSDCRLFSRPVRKKYVPGRSAIDSDGAASGR